jgi:coproporphyrinogen III oxidase-like Fe-S oxidoreductase
MRSTTLDAEVARSESKRWMSGLTAFREAGVTRLSYGVQSFREPELRRLSRLHSAGRAPGAGQARRVR